MTLTNPSDAELSKTFALTVAGWVPYVAPKNKGSLMLPYKWFDGAGMPQVTIAPFTQSADAVLPWLEKRYIETDLNGTGWSSPAQHYTSPPEWVVRVPGSNAEGRAPTFPRAAVIALLRASGVAINLESQ